METPTQDLISALYNSADPLCSVAAKVIEDREKTLNEMDNELDLMASSCKLMMEALMEIYKVSMSRDAMPKTEAVKLLKELNLRLKECGNIANDTLSLPTVQTIFKGYYY